MPALSLTDDRGLVVLDPGAGLRVQGKGPSVSLGVHLGTEPTLRLVDKDGWTRAELVVTAVNTAPLLKFLDPRGARPVPTYPEGRNRTDGTPRRSLNNTRGMPPSSKSGIPVDIDALSPDSRTHRATRVALDLIEPCTDRTKVMRGSERVVVSLKPPVEVTDPGNVRSRSVMRRGDEPLNVSDAVNGLTDRHSCRDRVEMTPYRKFRVRTLPSIVGALAVFLFGAQASGQTVVPFIEPDAGRAPLTDGLAPLPGGFDQARAIDMYIFKICERDSTGAVVCDDVVSSILGVVGRGGSVRVLLEPCPGAGPSICNDDTGPGPEAMRACELLVAGGAVVKRANPGDATLGIPKTHGKSIVFDDGASLKAFILTSNLVPSSLSVRRGETVRRDYGVLTNDPGVIENLSRVFAQDWGADPSISACGDLTQWPRAGDGSSQLYNTLVVTPDLDATTGRTFARDKLLGLIQSATTSLKIHMEKIAPNRGPGCPVNDRDQEILPALLAKAQQPGVDLQILLTAPSHEPCNQNVFDDINGVVPDRARFQTQLSMSSGPIAGRPHAKMIIVDGQRVYLGSHNLTRQSFDERREIGWVTDDPGVAEAFRQKFDADWVANQPVP